MNPNTTHTTAPSIRPAGVYPISIGAFSGLVVSDEGGYMLPLPQLIGADVPVDDLTALLRTHALSTTQVPLQISVLYVNTGQHLVLIDTGLGAQPGPAGVVEFVGKISQNLRLAGVAPDAIDTIILSHMHSDHVGGILDAQGQFAFPNARYVLARAEWDFWMGQPDLSHLRLPEPIKRRSIELAQSLLAHIEAKLTLIEPEQQVVPGIRAIPAPVDTPGHSAFSVSSEGETLLVSGDAWFHPIITPTHPEWHIVFDFDPEQAGQIRRELLERAAEEAWLVLAYHFSWPSLGHIVRRDQHWAWAPIEYRWHE
jgi:glyoxylase-like metal-dependent hydrolase (beta-lactamase superfamily II)